MESSLTTKPVQLSGGLLSFYDSLRQRVERFATRRGGEVGETAAQVLLLAPDVFFLLARLGLDRRTPQSARKMIWGALAYFLLPADLLPELFVGGVGFLDDLVLGCAVLARTLGPDLAPLAEEHWSGRGEVAEVVESVASSAEALLGEPLYRRVQRFLNRSFS